MVMSTQKNKQTERFKYNRMSQNVVDNLTGFTYPCNSHNTAQLLNKLNDKSDSNAELYWDLKKDYENCIEQKEIFKEELQAYRDVLGKYGIHSSTQLDEILNNTRIIR